MKKNSSLKQLIITILASGSSQFGSTIFAFAIGFYLLKTADSPIYFAASQAIAPILSLISLPFVGTMVDKYNKKKIICLSQLVSIVGLLIFIGVTLFFSKPSIASIYVIIAILRLSDQFTNTALLSASIGLVEEKDLSKLRGYEQTIVSISSYLAPILGGILFVIFPLAIFTGIELFCEVLSLILLLSLSFTQFLPKNTQKEQKENYGFLAGLKYIQQNISLKRIIFLFSLINLIITCFNVGLPILVVRNLHIQSFSYGLISGAFAVGGIVSGILIGNLKKEKTLVDATKYTLFLGIILVCYGLVAKSNVPSLVVVLLFILLNFLLAIVVSFINIPISIWLSKNIPENFQGRVFSSISTLVMCLQPIGIFFYGTIFKDNLNMNGLIFIFSGVVLAIFTTLIMKKDKA